MRRVVTGHNKDGQSIVSIDGPPACSIGEDVGCLLYTSPSPRDLSTSRMPSSA